MHATLSAPPRATLADLLRYTGKAELIGGRLVTFMPIGIRHSRIASEIFVSLRVLERTTNSGYAFDDNIGYRIAELPSGRESFSPDASFFAGQIARDDPGFVDGPPTFAVEVRSPDEYGPAAEAVMATKRADYFAAGTRAVWDVDPVAGTIALFIDDAENPVQSFHRGERANAGAALLGWSMTVDEIFDDPRGAG